MTPSPAPSVLAITDVAVLPLADATVRPAQTVIIRDGAITQIGPAAELAPPAGAELIDGAGRFLLPGLCDMHVHILATRLTQGAPSLPEAEMLARSREYLEMFLAHGITTIRNMAGVPLHLRLRAEVTEGKTFGPRIFTSGPILETRFTWPGLKAIGAIVASPAEAAAMVRANHRDGYDFIKIYNDIDADIYDALVRTSREVGLKIIGHVPFAAGLSGALQAKQDSIEHLRSYDFAADCRPHPPGARFEGWLYSSPARLAELAERTVAAGVWNVPTLVVESGIVPDGEAPPARDLSRLPEWLAEMLAADNIGSVFTDRQRRAIKDSAPVRLAMVGALDRAGARLMAGSDCPAGGLVPGDCLLRELELFVEAGVSPLRALQAATTRAAEFLGIQDQQGTVAVGKRADLLLLEANPLEDIAAVRRPAAVIAAGRRVPAEKLRDTSGPRARPAQQLRRTG